MKKILKSLVVSIMAIALLAGCGMKAQTGFKISSSGNVQVGIIAAYDNEMIDAMLTYEEDQNAQEIKTHTDAERWAFIDSSMSSEDTSDLEGYKQEKYDKDGYKGYQYTAEVGNIDSVTGTGSRVDVSSMSDFKGQALFTKDGDVYKSNMTIGKAADTSEYEDYESMGAVFETSFVVELPSKPISHNATKVSSDGKTLTWDLTKTGDIDFEFKLSGGSSGSGDTTTTGEDETETTGDKEDEKAEEKKESKKDSDDKDDSKIWLYVGIGAGALVLIIIIAAIAIASSKKKKAAANVQPAVMTPNFGQPAEPPVQPIQPQDPNNGPQA